MSEWDTAVFGVDVGILPSWESYWTAAGVLEANQDFDVVFVKAAGWIDPPQGAVAKDHVYDMQMSVAVANPAGISRLEGAPPPALLAVAEAGFLESRFHRDPTLADKAGVFYRKWLDDAKGRIVILNDAPSDAFLVETSDPDGAGRIDLVAVSGTRRDRGLGTRLVHGAVTRPGSPTTWRVKVSARNWRAVYFYERLGFMIRAAFTAFHLWTNEGERK